MEKESARKESIRMINASPLVTAFYSDNDDWGPSYFKHGESNYNIVPKSFNTMLGDMYINTGPEDHHWNHREACSDQAKRVNLRGEWRK